MGAGISQAAGFYHAYAQDGPDFPTIVATIGDSTFFHSGIPALANAVSQQARFILVILDNGTTAMTGHQPTPALGSPPVPIRNVVRGVGVGFLRELDPYDLRAFTACLIEADRYMRSEGGGVAVVIASHPCVLQVGPTEGGAAHPFEVTEECTGCEACLADVECPAMRWDEATGRVVIAAAVCNGCGVCVTVCPVEAIVPAEGGRR
jgi:indolepyruvate ferredoxin oxidoreductase alpha subunit